MFAASIYTRSLSCTVLAACIAAPCTAQSAPQLVNLTDVAPLVVTQDLTLCSTGRCVPPGMPSPRAQGVLAGGVAHDPTARGTWISDGTVVARIDARQRCNYQCSPTALPDLIAGQPVTGLAFDASREQLLAVDSANVLRRFTVQDCSPSLLDRCTLPSAPGETVTGITFDVAADLILYSAADWSAPGTAGGTVWITAATDPCTAICSVQINDCGGSTMGPITGLAFDSCESRLWATDGSLTVSGVLSLNGSSCDFVQDKCCPSSFGEAFVGLTLAPGTEASNGNVCSSSPCRSCPGMRHELVGDPVVGNLAFGARLTDAPAATAAYLVLNFGTCAAQGALSPPLCGDILVPLGPVQPILVGPIATSGTPGACGGETEVSLPLPAVPLLCGVELSSQFFGLCPSSGGIGTYVSNCLTWRL